MHLGHAQAPERGRTGVGPVLDRLVEQNPGFKVYVTGHSLGGALATLFSFQLASNRKKYPGIPSPITCISFASPKIGDESFCKAFQYLEERGEIRHLRVANENEPVTMVPIWSFNEMLMAALRMAPTFQIAPAFVNPMVSMLVSPLVAYHVSKQIGGKKR